LIEYGGTFTISLIPVDRGCFIKRKFKSWIRSKQQIIPDLMQSRNLWLFLHGSSLD